MTARDYIIRTLKRYRYGWRRLTHRWAPKAPLKRWYALKEFAWKKYLTAKAKRRPKKAQLWLTRHKRAKAQFFAEKRDAQALPDTGIITFDGKPCAAWIASEILQPARDSGTWDGTLTSGYRSPEYSQQLCYAICGAPSCSGTCAGTTSNHTRYVKPDGAVDVSDPAGLQAWCRAHGKTFYGNGQVLPSDIWHFSTWGN